MTVTETAPAKINLALHITARRDDGYHELDSLVAFADLGDELTIVPAEQIALEITGSFAPQLPDGPENIAIQAAQMLCTTWPQQFKPVSIHLVKNLPVASGIGGGSADAAAVLRGLLQLYGPAPDPGQLDQMALQLGADVPVCLAGRICCMRGTGEELTNLPTGPVFSAVLVNPGISVSTPKVFSQLGLDAGQPAMAPLPRLPNGSALADWSDWLSACRNDLQPPAISLVPEIETVLGVIGASPGCLLPRMSGSGATCFGLFKDRDAARQAAEDIAAAHPGWWVRSTFIS